MYSSESHMSVQLNEWKSQFLKREFKALNIQDTNTEMTLNILSFESVTISMCYLSLK